ncbi:MAG: hypothetical protein J6K01_01450 [Paludibacteraceae bacterium]|nr:hypothetical protein [Paludibacteraceae bacterium]
MMNPEGMTQNTSAALRDQILRTDGACSVSTTDTKDKKRIDTSAALNDRMLNNRRWLLSAAEAQRPRNANAQ